MKKLLRAAIVAAFVAPTLAGLAPQASAEQIEVGPVKVRTGPKERIEVVEPGVISVCIRNEHTCDPNDD